jgi:excinuclease ABC subunit A
MFSFNGPHGACPVCDGLGARTVVDPERVVPDPGRTLREGAVLAWGRRGSVALATELARTVEALGVSPDTPWTKLADDDKKAILFGIGAAGADGEKKPKRGAGKKKAYEGIVPRLEARLDAGPIDRDDDDPDADEGAIADDEMGRFLVSRTCDGCKGRRLRPEALAVKLGSKDISELGGMPLRRLRGSTGARRRCRPEKGSASGSRRRSARRSSASSTSSTSPASACTPATTPASSRPRCACAIWGTACSSSSTIAKPSSPPITSSTWAPAPACTAAPWSRRGRRRR